MKELREKVAQFHPDKLEANFLLLNYYGSGSSYISWHSDDENDLIDGAPIYSVTIGAERDFMVREQKKRKQVETNSNSTIMESKKLQSKQSILLWHTVLFASWAENSRATMNIRFQFERNARCQESTLLFDI